MNIKILGSGCPRCQSMYNDVTRIVQRNGWQAEIEYIQDFETILSYGVMSTPVLTVNEQIMMVGHHGISKIEQILRERNAK